MSSTASCGSSIARWSTSGGPFTTSGRSAVDDLDRAGGIEQAISAIGRGGLAIVVDSATDEDQGDLVMAAEHASAEAINFMVTYGRGLVCVPMLANRLQELAIPPIPSRGIDPLGDAFHISVDYLPQTTTGISAADRAAT